MDRTVIDTWKAEEKELSARLHKKLTALTLFATPTEEFRKCFVDDMFLKPNQKGFFHVMHYLFTMLDPVEFKKRFYWPITDRKSEGTFRSATIAYLTHLNEKHNLHWTNVKSYLVVMPGGMKFITFLSDFVDFVVRELIKQRLKYLTGDVEVGEVSELNLKRMRKQNSFFKEYASSYITEIDGHIATLKENLEILRKQLNIIAKATKLEPSQYMDDTFLRDFFANNRQLFEEKFCKKVKNIVSLESPLQELKEGIDQFQIKDSEVQYDKETVKRSLLRIQEIYPNENLTVDTGSKSDKLPIDSLIATFNCIYPVVERKIAGVEFKRDRSEFVNNELNALKADLLQIDTQITKFHENLKNELTAMEQKNHKQTPLRPAIHLPSSAASMLLAKFVNTPPIKLDMIENKQNANPRLPFLDDFGNCNDRLMASGTLAVNSFTLNNNPATSNAASRSAKKSDALKLSQTMNKSKIVDPIRLLRTLNKDTSKAKSNLSARNLSNLAHKWKEHEILFITESEPVADSSFIEQQSRPSISSPYSPFTSNDRTKVPRQQENQMDISRLTPQTLPNKKLSAVKKVQDASKNFQNLSTSPSGRLDPLVLFDTKDCPVILINDKTLHEQSASDSELLNIQSTPPATVPDKQNNKPGVLSNCFDFQNFNIDTLNQEDDDILFDVSDTVLNDVTI